MATGHIAEAQRILRKACRVNGKDYQYIEKVFLEKMTMSDSYFANDKSAKKTRVFGTTDDCQENRCESEEEEKLCCEGNGDTNRPQTDGNYQESLMKYDSSADGETADDDNKSAKNVLTDILETFDNDRKTENESTRNTPLDKIKREAHEREHSEFAKYTLMDLVKHRVVFVPFLVVTSVW